MIFNKQIMNLFFYFFLRHKLYQLQCFCIDHILNSILDTHAKRRTVRTTIINILISNNIQHLKEMIHLILDTFKLKQVSSHQLHHMSKFHIISSSDQLEIMFRNTIHLLQFFLGNMSTFFRQIFKFVKEKLTDSFQNVFFTTFFLLPFLLV